eukprot:6491452-Amphidinium_carterae.1
MAEVGAKPKSTLRMRHWSQVEKTPGKTFDNWSNFPNPTLPESLGMPFDQSRLTFARHRFLFHVLTEELCWGRGKRAGSAYMALETSVGRSCHDTAEESHLCYSTQKALVATCGEALPNKYSRNNKIIIQLKFQEKIIIGFLFVMVFVSTVRVCVSLRS